MQNTVRNTAFVTPDDLAAAGLGCQYAPLNIRFIGNTVKTCESGIVLDGPSLEGLVEVSGNMIFDIADETPDPNRPPGETYSNGWGIRFDRSGGLPLNLVSVIGNTIQDCEGGIAVNGGLYQPMTIQNNTFESIALQYCHIKFENSNARNDSNYGPPNNQVVPSSEPLRVCP